MRFINALRTPTPTFVIHSAKNKSKDSKKSLSTAAGLVTMLTILTGSLLLTACQKTDKDPTNTHTQENTHTKTDAQSQTLANNTSDTQASPDGIANADSDTQAASELFAMSDTTNMEADSATGTVSSALDPYHIDSNANVNKNSNAAIQSYQTPSTSLNTATPSLAPETQITEVEYQDKQGHSMYITFLTSATSELRANLRLPSGKVIVLTAPAAQGNNPTYRSVDGSIELVTHQGGSSIDLLFEGQATTLDAISTDTAVVKAQ
ncbi:hypothetical protein [Psychrobacter lutiphocae]|uniref:hypothetical protein n=1 Tax=Psychrobacter lutiphocae TaxID=540500 RepID=UPI00038208A3|nr:hypothetical protein [Psychrobacter lutiphocae]